MIWSNGNNVTYWVVLDASLTYSKQTINLSTNANTIYGCAFYNGNIYAVGHGGYTAVLAPNGQILAQSSATSAGNYETVVFSSESGMYEPFYAWSLSDAGTLVDYVNPNFGNVETKSLNGVSPLGGFAKSGYVYFYGASGIAKFTDPDVTFIKKLDAQVTTATFSPDGDFAYLFAASGECGVNLTLVTLDNFSLSQPSPLTPLNGMPSLCDWTEGATIAFTDSDSIYLYVEISNAVYKISRVSLQLTDSISEATIGTWVSLNALMANDNSFVGYSPDDRTVHKYYAGTCDTKSFFNAATRACVACSAGSWPSFPFSAGSCTPCPEGTFSSTTGCEPCPAGEYTNQPGMSQCLTCAPGQFPENNTCVGCPLNTYGSDDGTCTPCQNGTYTNTTGATVCTPCPDYEVSGNTTCKYCPSGTYISTPGSCVICPNGTFSTSPTATQCTACTLGTYSNGTNCLPCAPGSYGSSAGICTQCKAGTYQNTEGKTACIACSTGFFSNTTACLSCPAGTYYSNNTCFACPAGTHTASPGEETCAVCPDGTNSTSNSSMCTSCPSGTFGLNGTCSNCAEGTYTNTSGLSECTACPSGTFSTLTECLYCPSGTFLSNETCMECPAGTYSEKGLGCVKCDDGHVSGTNASTCTPCAVGYYSENNTCTECAPGTYTSSPGMGTCERCGAGTRSNSTACVICLPGTYSTDGINCTTCRAGYFTNSDGAHSCSPCPAGSFSSDSFAFCSLCLPGTFSETGSAKCTDCPPGTNTNASTGYSKCDRCPSGYIAAKFGQATCTKCPHNHYSDMTNEVCLSCSGDKWNNSGRCPPVGEIALLVPIVVLVGAGIAFIIWKTRKIDNPFRHHEMKDELTHDHDIQMTQTDSHTQ